MLEYSIDVFEGYTFPLYQWKKIIFLDGLQEWSVGGGGVGHYTQSNKGVCVNVLLSKRYILPLLPLGLYSGPSMTLVISFPRPNCLSFCLLFIRGIQSVAWENFCQWHKVHYVLIMTFKCIICGSYAENNAFQCGNFSPSATESNPWCPLDSWQIFWVQHKTKMMVALDILWCHPLPLRDFPHL